MSRIPPVYCEPCGHKRLYRSEIQARDGLGRMMRLYAKHRPDDYSLNVFPCSHKKGWHIGHHNAVRVLIETMT
jgi:hypothetical protein